MRYYTNANTARGDIAIVEMIQLGSIPFFAILQMQKSVNSADATAELASNTITANIVPLGTVDFPPSGPSS